MLRRLAVLDLALRSGCAYVHTPLGVPTNAKLSSGLVDTEAFFGLAHARCVTHTRPPAGTTAIDLSHAKSPTSWAGANAIGPTAWLRLRVQGSTVLTWGRVNVSSPSARSRERLREEVLARRGAHGPLPWYDRASASSSGCPLRVALHVRYGDLSSANGDALDRWVPSAYYLSVVPPLLAALRAAAGGDRTLELHVMSEGVREWAAQRAEWEAAFASVAERVTLHIDDDVLSTLAHLMEADVLLGSPSAFSALAALCAARTQLQLSFPKAYYAPPHDAAWQGLGLSLPAPPVCTCRTHGANASLSAALSSPHTAAGKLGAAPLARAAPAAFLNRSRYVHEEAHRNCSLWCVPSTLSRLRPGSDTVEAPGRARSTSLLNALSEANSSAARAVKTAAQRCASVDVADGAHRAAGSTTARRLSRQLGETNMAARPSHEPAEHSAEHSHQPAEHSAEHDDALWAALLQPNSTMACSPGEVVVDYTAQVVYVDNVKAASSSVRAFMATRGAQWVTWQCNNAADGTVANACWPCGRDAGSTSSHRRATKMGACCHNRQLACTLPQQPSWMWFSLVRDPMAKFVSGVHEAKVHDGSLMNQSADQILRTQLAMRPRTWVSEHLMPSWCRLRVRSATGFVALNLTAKLEHASADLLGGARRGSARQRAFFTELSAHLADEAKFERTSAQLDRVASQRGRPVYGQHALSPEAVAAFVAAPLFREDYLRYGYPFPE
jgi:hypothetical protein